MTTFTTTGTRFANSYTLDYDSPPPAQERNLTAMLEGIHGAVHYLSNYIDWSESVIDLGIKWFRSSPGQTPLIGAAYLSSILEDVINGRDKVIGQHDAQFHVYLDPDYQLRLGTLEFYDVEGGGSPGPGNYIPYNSASYFEIILHELLHQFGLVDPSRLPTETRNGVQYVVSPSVLELLPSGLPLSVRDGGVHYASSSDAPRDEIIFGGIMWDGFLVPSNSFGNGNNNGGGFQRELGKIDLALLRDLGYKVYWDDSLPLYAPMHQKIEADRVATTIDTLLGSGKQPGNRNLIGSSSDDVIIGSSAKEFIDGREGGDVLTGGSGVDVFGVRFGESGVRATDKITDFTFGQDKFYLLSSDGVSLMQPGSLSRTNDDQKSTNLLTLARRAFTDSNSLLKGRQPLAPGGAVVVTATNPRIAGTYLLINDSNRSFNPASDIIIELNGFDGSALGIGSHDPSLLFA